MNEYWKWPEAVWISDAIDWRSAGQITAGVDLGTSSTQAVILCDGALFAYSNLRTGADFKKTAESALGQLLDAAGMKLTDIRGVGGTGFGRKNITAATKLFDEVHCHAKGARFMYGPEVHTVLDLGGQFFKAALLYDWDRVRDIMINDTCGNGEGRNLEMICDILEVPITEIGDLSLDVPFDPEPVSNTCWAFADTETVGLLGKPEYRSKPLTENQIFASHLFAIAWRAIGTVGRLAPLDTGDPSVTPKLGFTGGLAKVSGITKRIEREFHTEAAVSDIDPMLAGAIGAALLV